LSKKKKEWTNEQRQSFSAHGGTLLVSAAAGSGKTAVLVERVIRMITDPDHPVDVDRLLIVTFTRAAAAEMRGRLSDALAKKMAEEPDNPVYLHQQMLLPRAYISTIHGFCSRLLQEFSAQAQIPFGFKVAEEGQTKLLKAQALNEVLEQQYQKKDKNFLDLAQQLCNHKNDKGLRETVLSGYEFIQAQPFPEQWLQEKVDAYTKVMPLEQTPWMKHILAEVELALERMLHYAQRMKQLVKDYRLTVYEAAVLKDLENLTAFRDALPGITYAQLQQRLSGLSLSELDRLLKPDALQAAGKAPFSGIRKKLTDRMKQLKEMLPCDEEECREDLAKLAPMVEVLGQLILAFTDRFTALKRQQKWLDYNDLEQVSLRLLIAEDGTPTPIAREVAERFEEIMVDECQDTNAAQAKLFDALSKEGKNLFMVGDVKQSIYSFRQAMPIIFTKRRGSYTPYDEEKQEFPATITLGNNFRSREQVTGTVNFLFRQLMMRRLGDVEYDKREALVPSAEYPEADYVTEWMVLDKSEATDDVSEVQREARQIGQRILELRQTMTIQREDEKEDKRIRFKEFCILHRKRSDMPIFFKELTQMGIPVAVDKAERFLDTTEVGTALSLLRVIDNPLREVALAAVMLSPLYGFTPDEMAQIRISADQYTPLYVAVEQASKDATHPALAKRLNSFLEELRRFRTLAVSLPADRLLETVMRETDMEAVFLARSGGGQRVANLQQLDRIARSFDPGEYRGLSAFIRYVDRIEESGEDLPSGDTLQQDGVRLLTVHGSKGLEFPVVFVSRLSKKRGGTDHQKRVLFHAEAGIGMKLIDSDETHKPLPYMGVYTARLFDEAAEDLRVWYVALTRAREKLILVDTVENPENLLQRLEWELPDREQLLPDTILRAQCPGDILLAASLRHPYFASLRQTHWSAALKADHPWQVTMCPELKNDHNNNRSAPPPVKKRLAKKLSRRLIVSKWLRSQYAPLLDVPAKLAASQLSHQQMSRDYIAASRPAFLQTEGLTPAQKGTATHTFMQFADYGAACTDLLGEIDRLTAAGFLTVQQATSLNIDRLTAFFSGELYRRMTVSPQMWREYPFAVMVPAGTLADLPEEMTGEEVLVQGIADCVFREGDGLVLVDYKTDRVKTGQELCDRYRDQMLFYKQALQTILGLPVKEMLLYSFALGDTVEVK